MAGQKVIRPGKLWKERFGSKGIGFGPNLGGKGLGPGWGGIPAVNRFLGPTPKPNWRETIRLGRLPLGIIGPGKAGLSGSGAKGTGEFRLDPGLAGRGGLIRGLGGPGSETAFSGEPKGGHQEFGPAGWGPLENKKAPVRRERRLGGLGKRTWPGCLNAHSGGLGRPDCFPGTAG